MEWHHFVNLFIEQPSHAPCSVKNSKLDYSVYLKCDWFSKFYIRVLTLP